MSSNQNNYYELIQNIDEIKSELEYIFNINKKNYDTSLTIKSMLKKHIVFSVLHAKKETTIVLVNDNTFSIFITRGKILEKIYNDIESIKCIHGITTDSSLEDLAIVHMLKFAYSKVDFDNMHVFRFNAITEAVFFLLFAISKGIQVQVLGTEKSQKYEKIVNSENILSSEQISFINNLVQQFINVLKTEKIKFSLLEQDGSLNYQLS